MSFAATVIQVMIASPSDVREESRIIETCILDWNAINSSERKVVFVPVTGSEHTPHEMGQRPQEFINSRLLKDCDLLIAVFGTRFGSDTGRFASGTIEEIHEHRELNKPTLIYFSSKPVQPDSLFKDEQYRLLLDFKQKCKTNGFIGDFSSSEELRSKVMKDLTISVQKNPYLLSLFKTTVLPLPVPPPSSSVPFSSEAITLLKETSIAKQNLLLAIGGLTSIEFSVNGKNYGSENARESARWESAINELIDAGMLTVTGRNNDIFKMTDKGWTYIENNH